MSAFDWAGTFPTRDVDGFVAKAMAPHASRRRDLTIAFCEGLLPPMLAPRPASPVAPCASDGFQDSVMAALETMPKEDVRAFLDFAGTCQGRLYAAEDRAYAGARGARMGAVAVGCFATLSAFALAAASAVRDGPHDLPSATTVGVVCAWTALALWAAATMAIARRDARSAS